MAATRRLLQRVSTAFSTVGALRSYGVIDGVGIRIRAHNYHPVPVVFSRATGTIWDSEGKRYINFLAAYSAVNQGHCHPKIIKALQEQVEKLTLSSRAFYNDQFPVFAERLRNMLGYEMVLPMKMGTEGVETALKVARKWGHERKTSPKMKVKKNILHLFVSQISVILSVAQNIISMSCDNDATRGFGPLLPGNLKVDFGDADSLENIFKEWIMLLLDSFLFEPNQGEAGVVIPPEGYLKAVRELSRSGKMLACDWEEVRPDMVILGKALGGGVIPVSAVLADKDVMLHIKPGQHGSTFGGNPLASDVAMASLDVIEKEKLVERSASHGEELRIQLNEIKKQYLKYIKEEEKQNNKTNLVTLDKSGAARLA
ncbi:hypothetical protein HID58_033479 [Brassica napus]|uniref:Ornithine aminotransferase n=1 Tax=Brassica napus TaxID=3708 RepID=A0ABQ8BZJ5_BRANA|nr:hypothetical protein HID58_033479 [Brassica napus]